MSNQEKVARAAQRHPDCKSEEGLNQWHCTGCGEVVATGSKHRARAAFHKHQAAAAIDALADVDAIAGVLEKHEPWGWSEQGVSCICDRNALLDSWSEHAAAAVVAWMKDAL